MADEMLADGDTRRLTPISHDEQVRKLTFSSVIRQLYSKPGQGSSSASVIQSRHTSRSIEKTLIWNTYFAIGGRVFIELHRTNFMHYNNLIDQ